MRRRPVLFLIFSSMLLVASLALQIPAVNAEVHQSAEQDAQSYFVAGGLVPCDGIHCRACDLVSLLNRIINFAIGLSIPISMVLFAYAGVLYFTSVNNPGNITKARGIFLNVLVGLAIALGAYVAVETTFHIILDPSFFKTSSGAGSWNQIQCSAPGSRPMDASVGDIFGQAKLPQAPATAVTGTTGSASTANGNITFAPGKNLTAVDQQAIDTLNAAAAKCGCTVLVTSANDGLHTTNSLHSVGQAVDVGYNAQLTTYLDTNYPKITNYIDPGQPAYIDPTTGYVWSVEQAGATAESTGLHYHVSSTGH